MIVLKNQLGPEQLNIVRSLADRSGVSVPTAKILYTRGVDTVNKVKRFLSPGKQHFTSPFELKGVSEAVERITAARDGGETVVIYGDYDADGICATPPVKTTFVIEAYESGNISAMLSRITPGIVTSIIPSQPENKPSHMPTTE